MEQFTDNNADESRKETKKLSMEEHIQLTNWLVMKKDFEETVEFCTRNYGQGYYPDVQNFYGKLETRAKRGETFFIEKALEFIRDFNENHSRPFVTSRHKIWKLKEVAEKAKKKREELSQRKNEVIEFEGGKVVQNWAIDRIQIFFDEIPPKEVCKLLNDELSFNFSRSNGNAWQRKNTDNGIRACRRFLKIYKTELDQEKLTQSLIQMIEESRTDHTPKIGDTVQYTHINGKYYPEAIIHNKIPSYGYPIYLQPETVLVRIDNWHTKHFHLDCLGTGEGLPDFSNFKPIGKGLRSFRYKGELREIEFSATVNVWEYKETPESRKVSVSHNY